MNYELAKVNENIGRSQLKMEELFIGETVFASYNNKMYRVAGIDYRMSSDSTFILNDGSETTLKDYFERQYNLTIRALRQPALVSKGKNKQPNGAPEYAYLLPELCYPTGLTDTMREDFRHMKELSRHTRMDPEKRRQTTEKLLTMIHNNEKCCALLANTSSSSNVESARRNDSIYDVLSDTLMLVSTTEGRTVNVTGEKAVLNVIADVSHENTAPDMTNAIPEAANVSYTLEKDNGTHIVQKDGTYVLEPAYTSADGMQQNEPNVEVDIEGMEMLSIHHAINGTNEEVSGGEDDDHPPMLEKSAEFRYVADKAISKEEAEKINNYNIKLFEDKVGETEYGDRYATIIPERLSYLLRKNRIIELLTEPSDIEAIRGQGWMTSKPPRLPPLVGTKACFAFYIDGSAVSSVRELSSDDLKPWTTTDPVEGEPTIKSHVRKHAVKRIDGRFELSKGDGRSSEFHLTEYSARLPRLLRLRKKIFYIARQDGQIVGNVLILYNFTMPGEIPSIMNIAHGNDALRDMQLLDLSMKLPVADADNPFIEGVVPGVRGEKFLKVHPSKIGWVNNKTLLLKYLINDPTFLDEAGYLNTDVPFLPPMIEERGVFVHFFPATLVAHRIHSIRDGLSPWTFKGAMHNRVKTVRRALMRDSEGVFRLTKQVWQQTGFALVETKTVLERCPRLRRRVVSIQRNDRLVLGIVCFMYEYIREVLPKILRDNSITVPGPPTADSQSTTMSTSMDKSHSSDIQGNSGVGDDFVDEEEIVEGTDENDMSMSG